MVLGLLERPHEYSTKCVRFYEKNYHYSLTYPDFTAEFTVYFFNPEEWADIFKTAGAKSK
jgi:alpha-L-fucosidase